jgi:hypothetical protein
MSKEGCMRGVFVVSMALMLSTGAAAMTVEVSGKIFATAYAPEQPETAAAFKIGEPYVITYEWNGPGAVLPAPLGSTVASYPNAGNTLLFSSDDYWISSAVVGYALSGQAGIYSRVNVSSRWYQFSSSPETPLSFTALLDGRFPYYVGIELDDPTGTSLLTLDLTSPVFDLADYPVRQLEIAFAKQIVPSYATDVIRVRGTIDSMTLVTAIPEPRSILLALMGTVVVAGAARRATRAHATH